jgi:hypothetical protein
LYTDLNDTTHLVCSDRSDLELDVLVMTLAKFSTDPSSHDFNTPPELCAPICLNQVVRSLLLSEMSSLDDIDLAARQVGDPSHGVCMPRTSDASARRSTNSVSNSGKGKGVATSMRAASKQGSQPQHVDIEVSSEADVPL